MTNSTPTLTHQQAAYLAAFLPHMLRDLTLAGMINAKGERTPKGCLALAAHMTGWFAARKIRRLPSGSMNSFTAWTTLMTQSHDRLDACAHGSSATHRVRVTIACTMRESYEMNIYRIWKTDEDFARGWECSARNHCEAAEESVAGEDTPSDFDLFGEVPEPNPDVDSAIVHVAEVYAPSDEGEDAHDEGQEIRVTRTITYTAKVSYAFETVTK